MSRGFLLVFAGWLVAACGGAVPEGRLAPRPAPAPASSPAAASDLLAGIVEGHNAVRRAVLPTPLPALAPLRESAELVADARAWAAGCRFEHAPAETFGENLYASSDSPTARAVVDSWAAEAGDYDLAANRCSGVCGHYTQMVWRDTARVGCAAQRCRSGSPFGSRFPEWWLVVCRYEPPGNYMGERPY